ncbi:DUF1223 domain-containing protein [Thalassovita sp.]|uniref:DUF1223 domain-containing protein n=1 Tax=Thalassovita sp. TaxID=1979401 RepID=UPI002881B490|nr:DUF1223 domain-containing protein [Thalassovita sp.]MDF1801531.1 DUF1223 domain-containing protein [Thalassovita sp.]
MGKTTQMRQVMTWIAAAWMATVGPVWAGDHPVVVELYTSQGCSSCPPADALLGKLAKRDDVIALALHVDYWDYIGWKDAFASAQFTARQKAYAIAAGRRSVYTPQMIVGGQEHVVGNHPKDVSALIKKHAAGLTPVSVRIERKGNRLEIEAEAHQPMSGTVLVQVIRYRPSARVMIKKGENAGRTVDYSNIVTDWSVLGEWNTRAPLEINGTISGDAPVVVILQEKRAKGPGAILAAARLR